MRRVVRVVYSYRKNSRAALFTLSQRTCPLLHLEERNQCNADLHPLPPPQKKCVICAQKDERGKIIARAIHDGIVSVFQDPPPLLCQYFNTFEESARASTASSQVIVASSQAFEIHSCILDRELELSQRYGRHRTAQDRSINQRRHSHQGQR